MNKQDIVQALLKRIDVADGYRCIHTFDEHVLEQSPNLADLLNDLANAHEYDDNKHHLRLISESIHAGAENVADDILESYED